jgi:hypothetical protein
MSYVSLHSIQGLFIRSDSLPPLRPTVPFSPPILYFPIALEMEFVDIVPEIVVVTVLEIWNEVVSVASLGEERTARGEVEIACDFVDTNSAGKTASFRVLFVNIGRPVFGHALHTE